MFVDIERLYSHLMGLCVCVCVMDYQHRGSVMLKGLSSSRLFCVWSPSLLTLGAECVVQPVPSLGGALCTQQAESCAALQCGLAGFG